MENIQITSNVDHTKPHIKEKLNKNGSYTLVIDNISYLPNLSY